MLTRKLAKKLGLKLPAWARGTSADPDNPPVIDNAPMPNAPVETLPNGTAVTISGEVPGDTQAGDYSVHGAQARVDGQPYCAEAGPNKGQLVQPVKTQDGRLLGVPTAKMRSCGVRGGGGSSRVGWTPEWDAAYDRAFGRKSKRR